MARRDIYHECVKIALVKDGWIVTDDPLDLSMGLVDLLADLGAEKWLEAEIEGIKIAVEVKNFTGIGLVSEFHKAMGQYEHYRYSLRKNEPDRKLYLAISQVAWDDFFQRPFVQEIIADKTIKLLIFDSEKQEIITWIE